MVAMPKNRFKAGLKEGRSQIGVWNSIGGSAVAELLGTCGFDWITIDTEHAPVDVTDVLPSLQALAAYPEVSALVRPAANDTVLIKRHLDQGAQTLIVPYVQNVAEAEAAVAAMRYPPRGIRGVAGMTRASRFGTVEGYATKVEEELCLIVQVETLEAMAEMEAIATVDGVDGVFIGPADLAASMGLPGQPNHPDVCAKIEEAIGRLNTIGVPAGILTMSNDFAARCIELGTLFTGIAMDSTILAGGAKALRGKF